MTSGVIGNSDLFGGSVLRSSRGKSDINKGTNYFI